MGGALIAGPGKYMGFTHSGKDRLYVQSIEPLDPIHCCCEINLPALGPSMEYIGRDGLQPPADSMILPTDPHEARLLTADWTETQSSSFLPIGSQHALWLGSRIKRFKRGSTLSVCSFHSLTPVQNIDWPLSLTVKQIWTKQASALSSCSSQLYGEDRLYSNNHTSMSLQVLCQSGWGVYRLLTSQYFGKDCLGLCKFFCVSFRVKSCVW